jgi:ABC-2 type transport system ATP-binding protein
MKRHGIKVTNLTKDFKDLRALNNVSFTIEKPGLYGLIGPNAAGKTTLLKCISSLLVPTEGDVFINNTEVNTKNLAIRSKIGFLPEDSGLYDKLTAKDFLHIMAGMHGLSREQRKKRVNEVVEYVGIDFSPNKIVRYLSTGQRRLLLFASVLLHNPEILILDESLSGLDPINREQLAKIMRKTAEEKIVLFSSHILSDIWSLCERIFVLKEGVLIVDDHPDSILSKMTDDSYFITTKSSLEEVKNHLEKQDFISSVKIKGDTIIFHVKESEKLNSAIAKMIEDFEISSFGPNVPDLDQIFTRLVNAS